MSIPGPPHSEPPRCPGHTSHAPGNAQQFVVQRGEHAVGALLAVDREVGPRDVADEQAVTGQHCPWLGPAGRVGERERCVLGAMAGGVQRAHADAPELELPAIVKGVVLILRARVAVHMDRGAGRGCEPTVARDMIGVVVGLEDVLDRHPHVAREGQVLLDIELGVDNRRESRPLVTDQVRGAAEIIMGDLAEDHRRGFLSGQRDGVGSGDSFTLRGWPVNRCRSPPGLRLLAVTPARPQACAAGRDVDGDASESERGQQRPPAEAVEQEYGPSEHEDGEPHRQRPAVGGVVPAPLFGARVGHAASVSRAAIRPAPQGWLVRALDPEQLTEQRPSTRRHAAHGETRRGSRASS